MVAGLAVTVGQLVVRVLIQRELGAAALGQFQAAVNALPKVSGAWGSGRVLEGTLFSLVLTDNGRVAIGAVAPDALYAALAAPAAG